MEEIRFLELPKMLKDWEKRRLKAEDPLTKWFLFLEANEDQKIASTLEVKAMSDPVLQKAIKEWQRLSQDPKTRAQYLSRLKWKMDYYSAIKTAEAKGEARGEIKAKRDAIGKFLAKRFGPVSTEIQAKIQQLTGLETLDWVMGELFAVNSPAEARRIIEEGLNKTSPQK